MRRLLEKKRICQCGQPKVRRFLEGGACLSPGAFIRGNTAPGSTEVLLKCSNENLNVCTKFSDSFFEEQYIILQWRRIGPKNFAGMGRNQEIFRY